MTPLFSATFGGHADLVELLLANGADLSARNEDGETAFASESA